MDGKERHKTATVGQCDDSSEGKALGAQILKP